MPRDVPGVSRDAYASLDPDREQDWTRRIMEALRDEPDTIRWLAARFAREDGADAKAVYHDVERRASKLYADGYLERGTQKANPSGRDAYIHHVSPAGKVWMRGGPRPKPRTRRRDLEAAVIHAAMEATEAGGSLDALRAAVAALKAYGSTDAPGLVDVDEAARQGVYVGRSGNHAIEAMDGTHLIRAIDRLRRDGVSDAQDRLRCLVAEAARRNLWV